MGDERKQLDAYLSFVGQRAAGELKTTASWLREQVLAHPDYRRDSVISDGMCHDLMARCAAGQYLHVGTSKEVLLYYSKEARFVLLYS